MLRKLMPVAAAVSVLALAHSYATPPAGAVPLHIDAASRRADAGTVFVRRHWWSGRGKQRPSGVAVFIVPGVYWGPAWWDPGFSPICWKKTRQCRDCAENWVYAC
jgi:hypothetical protein